MDGHDENVDGAGLGQNSQLATNNMSATGQGTETILPGAITSTPSMATPQVYNAQDYIDHPTRSVATGTGDIKLGGGETQQKVAVDFVDSCGHNGGCGGIYAIFFSSPSQAEVQDSLKDFTSYAKYGPSSAHYQAQTNGNGEKEWFLEYLGDFVYIPAEQGEYVNTLRERYAKFQSQLNKSKLKPDEEVSNALEYSAGILDVSLLYLNLDNISNKLIGIYNTDGAPAAIRQVNELVNLQGTNTATDGLVSSMREYLTTEISLRKIYDDNNCIIDGVIQPLCTRNITNSNYSRLLTASEQSSFNMGRYFRWGVVDLKSNINTLSEWLSE